MNNLPQRFAVILFLTTSIGSAQPKGQNNQQGGQQTGGQQAGGQQQNAQQTGGSTGLQNVPPQLYRLEDLPNTRAGALAALTRPHQRRIIPFSASKPPGARFIWYVTKKSTSTSLPVLLEAMTCGDIPKSPEDTWAKMAADNFDSDFVAACKGANPSLAPSLPSQNTNPLKIGDALIVAIYDKDDLLFKSHASLVGMNVTSQTGSVLNTDPVRPTISASGSGGGGGQGAGGGGGGQGAAAQPPGYCDLSIDGTQEITTAPLRPFSLSVLAKDMMGNPLANANITFTARRQEPTATVNSDPTMPLVVTVNTDQNGKASIVAVAGPQRGGYQVKAECSALGGSIDVSFAVRSSAVFYYIPWNGNPLLGDTVLSVSITAQIPTPTAVTFGTDPLGLTMPAIIVDGERLTGDPVTRTYPAGSSINVAASATVTKGSDSYTFLRWSDGGAQLHDVGIGATAMTLTAQYVKNNVTFPVTLLTNPPGVPITTLTTTGCTLGATTLNAQVWMCVPSATFEVKAEQVQRVPGHTYYFTGWSDGGQADHTLDKPITEPVTLTANFSDSPAGGTAVSFVTGPPGLKTAFTVDGTTYTFPQVLYLSANSTVTIDVPVRQNLDGTLDTCTASSVDSGGSVCHGSLTVPANPTTVTATFTSTAAPPASPPLLTLSTDPAGMIVQVINETDAANPVTTTFILSNANGAPTPFAAGDKVKLRAVPNQYNNGVLYNFKSWSNSTTVEPEYTLAAGMPVNAKATFAATSAATTPLMITVATSPPGLVFSVNGVASQSAARVGFFQQGASIALSTTSQQTFAGTQYSFQGWSDGGTTPTHIYAAPAASQQSQVVAPAVTLTAVFTPSTPAVTEQSSNLLNTNYPQVHNSYRFNISTGLIFSNLHNPSWTRQETAVGVTCPAGVTPCVSAPALYQTVLNPRGPLTIDPAMFFTVYWPHKFDAERTWHKSNLIPAPTFGISISSPTSDYFAGLSSEVVRGVQLVYGMHLGNVNRLVLPQVNDPTSSAAPQTVQRLSIREFVGVTFNVTFITSLFTGKAPAGGQ